MEYTSCLDNRVLESHSFIVRYVEFHRLSSHRKDPNTCVEISSYLMRSFA